MKKLLKAVAMAVLSIAMMAGFASCSNDDLGQAPESVNTRAMVYISANTVITANTTWSNTNTYVLMGKVYVKAPATLTIQAGTKIYGTSDISDPNMASALIVTRGAKLIANGTATNPIVFSAINGKPGGWGGIVILGNAPTNQTNPMIEGINPNTVPADVEVTYGGSNASDNSGSLQYVRVEYAGAAIADANELNSFTFGGVGSGTTLNHLQAYYGEDDAFEFFGGTVNAKYLVATAPDDDAFDFDFGYTGKIQFAVSTIDPAQTYSKDPNGIECDNEGTTPYGAIPFTRPVLSNLTLVGTADGRVAGTANGTGLLKSAANFRRNCQFTLVNSVLYGFPQGILKETTNSFVLKNNVVSSVPAGKEFVTFAADASNKAVSVSGITLTSPFGAYKSTALVPTGGAALDGSYYTHSDAWFTATSYKGAIPQTGGINWLLIGTWVK